MTAETFVEKILGAPEGTIVFRTPDIVLTHDSTIGVKNNRKVRKRLQRYP